MVFLLQTPDVPPERLETSPRLRVDEGGLGEAWSLGVLSFPSRVVEKHEQRLQMKSSDAGGPEVGHLHRPEVGAQLPQCLRGRESACNKGAPAGDMGSTPGSGRSPGGGHGNPLQDSGLENPMDRGAWQAAVHSFTEPNTK